MLVQYPDDLLFRKPALTHRSSPLWRLRTLPKSGGDRGAQVIDLGDRTECPAAGKMVEKPIRDVRRRADCSMDSREGTPEIVQNPFGDARSIIEAALWLRPTIVGAERHRTDDCKRPFGKRYRMLDAVLRHPGRNGQPSILDPTGLDGSDLSSALAEEDAKPNDAVEL